MSSEQSNVFGKVGEILQRYHPTGFLEQLGGELNKKYAEPHFVGLGDPSYEITDSGRNIVSVPVLANGREFARYAVLCGGSFHAYLESLGRELDEIFGGFHVVGLAHEDYDKMSINLSKSGRPVSRVLANGERFGVGPYLEWDITSKDEGDEIFGGPVIQYCGMHPIVEKTHYAGTEIRLEYRPISECENLVDPISQEELKLKPGTAIRHDSWTEIKFPGVSEKPVKHAVDKPVYYQSA